MAVKSSSTQYGSRAVMFHWLTALLILSMIPLGLFMHELPKDGLKETLYKVHIIIGAIVFIVTILRIIWKLMDNKTAEIKDSPKYQQIIAKAMHYALYLIMLGASASGLGFIILSGLGEQLFIADTVVWPNAHDFVPANVHGILTKLLIPLLGLHIIAALYHQFFVKDGIFSRMWFKN